MDESFSTWGSKIRRDSRHRLRTPASAYLANNRQMGKSGRKVILHGIMTEDMRTQMANLDDNVLREFSDGSTTFNARMLKPHFVVDAKKPLRIFYDVALLESN